MNVRTAEIITVGSEYGLSGKTADSSAVISRLILARGITLSRVSFATETAGEIAKALAEAITRSRTIVLTGASDEFPVLASKVLCEMTGERPALNAEMVRGAQGYARRNRAHASQLADFPAAYTPKSAQVYCNDTVPLSCYSVVVGSNIVLVMPGNAHVVAVHCADILAHFEQDIVVGAHVGIIGCPKRKIMEVADRIDAKFEGIKCSAFFGTGESSIEIMVDSEEVRGFNKKKRAAEICSDAVEMIYQSEVGKCVYGVNTDLPHAIVSKLAEAGKTVAFAESCTGGLLSKMLTDVPGSSAVFPGGIVSYSNKVKMRMLGVSEATLATDGAVSHKTASQMASGIRAVMETDWGIGVTGIAGPDGGSEEKPVGLVYACISDGEKHRLFKFNLGGDREQIRYTAAKYVMREFLLRLMHRSDESEDEE